MTPYSMPTTSSSSADHLFGHPSTLHPSWPPTTSIPPSTSSTSPPTFSSLANSPPTLPPQHHIFPPTPTA
jgi:hypothetical protein